MRHYNEAMKLELQPNLKRFVDEQVKAGYFPTPEAVVQASLSRMMDERDEITLTAEDLAAIKRSDEQIERGEYVEFDEFAARMRKKYGIT
jgi:Arc/MetJ-type ribon-helix-helix transcriptional regulator